MLKACVCHSKPRFLPKIIIVKGKPAFLPFYAQALFLRDSKWGLYPWWGFSKGGRKAPSEGEEGGTDPPGGWVKKKQAISLPWRKEENFSVPGEGPRLPENLSAFHPLIRQVPPNWSTCRCPPLEKKQVAVHLPNGTPERSIIALNGLQLLILKWGSFLSGEWFIVII